MNKEPIKLKIKELDPDMIHTPGIYVNRIFKGVNYEKRIEQVTVTKRG